MSVETDRAKQRRDERKQHSRYDQDLLAAKNDGIRVRFTLDIPAKNDTEAMAYVGAILLVDRFQVKIEHGILGKTIWLNKGHIVSTEIGE